VGKQLKKRVIKKMKKGVKMKRFLFLFASFGLILSLISCATIMTGSSQDINFSSNPAGAQIKINGVSMGSTPMVLKLKSGKEHAVKLELSGYLPYETQITKSVSGWVWGNLLFGGIPGLIVDFATGGIYKLNQDQISAQLQKNGMGEVELKDGNVYVFVTMKPDHTWEKIGQLERQ
jgi:hypothetical protein